MRALILASTLFGCAGSATAQTTIPIHVLAAYLHADPVDSTIAAYPVPLASLGLAPGMTIALQPVGDWDNGPGGDVYLTGLGVFSGSATLLAPALPHRVPDAIDAGIDNYTPPTWPSNEPTEIPEDFAIWDAGVTVVIPAGATHLFLTVADIYYEDNSDPDGDYGMRITLVPTTTAPIASIQNAEALSARPNPFESRTSVRFQTQRSGTVRLTIHDVAGRLVCTLLAGVVPAGEHVVTWDGRTDLGNRAAPGTYFARLFDGERPRAVRVSLVR